MTTPDEDAALATEDEDRALARSPPATTHALRPRVFREELHAETARQMVRAGARVLPGMLVTILAGLGIWRGVQAVQAKVAAWRDRRKGTRGIEARFVDDDEHRRDARRTADVGGGETPAAPPPPPPLQRRLSKRERRLRALRARRARGIG